MKALTFLKDVELLQLVPEGSVRIFLELRELTSYKQNYKNLRQRLQTIDYPCIPFIGTFGVNDESTS